MAAETRWRVHALPYELEGAPFTLSVSSDDPVVVGFIEQAALNAEMTIERLPDLDLTVAAPDDYTPRGQLVGVVDEYGTIWAAEPGASERIGDLVGRSDEAAAVYLDLGGVKA